MRNIIRQSNLDSFGRESVLTTAKVRQEQLDAFIQDCRKINNSFQTGKTRFGRSSLYGLLEYLRSSVNRNDGGFDGTDGALSFCRNPHDSRLMKYMPAIRRLVSVWGSENRYGGFVIKPLPGVAPHVLAPRTAASALQLLRTDPDIATKSYAFRIIGGNGEDNFLARGGRCTLRCEGRGPVYDIIVTESGSDWYIPYEHSKARYIQVPFKQPDNTLIVTGSMSGCGLEVHEAACGNMFYHDSDCKNMRKSLLTTPKIRIDANKYEGAEREASRISARLDRNLQAYLYEHDVIFVMKGGVWRAYQTAIVGKRHINTDEVHFFQVKNKTDNYLGHFTDYENVSEIRPRNDMNGKRNHFIKSIQLKKL
jgi:hypothetical protein